MRDCLNGSVGLKGDLISMTFSQAYYSLLNFKEKKDNKVCVLMSHNLNRVNELIDFFEDYSKCSVSRVSLKIVMEEIMMRNVISKESVRAIIKNINKSKSEYLIIEDKGDMSNDFSSYSDLLDVANELGKNSVVIFVSEYACELSLLLGVTTIIDVTCKNEESLKLKYMPCSTEEIVQRNECLALKTGVMWSNEDFFDNYIKKKLQGDIFFEECQYAEALSEYSYAFSYHDDYIDDDCPFNDILDLTLLVRCLACFVFGDFEFSSVEDEKDLDREIKGVLNKLKKSNIKNKYKKMILDYEEMSYALMDGGFEKMKFLLLLRNYVV